MTNAEKNELQNKTKKLLRKTKDSINNEFRHAVKVIKKLTVLMKMVFIKILLQDIILMVLIEMVVIEMVLIEAVFIEMVLVEMALM